MSTHEELPGLPPDIQACIDADRQVHGLPPDVQARLRQRLVRSAVLVGTGAVATAAVSQATTAVAKSMAGATSAVGGGATAAGTTGVASAAGTFLVTKGSIAVAAVILGSAGAGGYAVSQRASHAPVAHSVTTAVAAPRTLASARLSLPPPTAPSHDLSAAPSASAAAISSTSASSSPSVTAPSATSAKAHVAVVELDHELASERQLLEATRAALARNEPASALSSIEQHASRFPRGRLAEERDFLRIRTLLALDQTDEARRRAQRFRQDHPRSILLAAIVSALGDEQ